MLQHPARRVQTAVILLLGSFLALTACSDSTGVNGAGNVSLSFSVPAPGLRSASVSPSLVPITDKAGNVVDLQSAQVVLSELELERSDHQQCTTTTSTTQHEDGCEEFATGPVLVNLNVAGGVTTFTTDPIPPGTYDRLKLKVEQPDEDNAATRAFRTANSSFPASASVHLTGTFNGQAFDVFIGVEAEMELHFATPLTIGGTSAQNVTVEIDVSKWLLDASGNFIDPRTLASNSTARERVRANIKAAFRAFRDDNRNGNEHDD